MDNNKDKLFNLYTLAEMTYIEHFKGSVENINSLFPKDWYEIQDYKLKIEILAESIKQNLLIVNNTKYEEFVNMQKKIQKNNNKIY